MEKEQASERLTNLPGVTRGNEGKKKKQGEKVVLKMQAIKLDGAQVRSPSHSTKWQAHVGVGCGHGDCDTPRPQLALCTLSEVSAPAMHSPVSLSAV